MIGRRIYLAQGNLGVNNVLILRRSGTCRTLTSYWHDNNLSQKMGNVPMRSSADKWMLLACFRFDDPRPVPWTVCGGDLSEGGRWKSLKMIDWQRSCNSSGRVLVDRFEKYSKRNVQKSLRGGNSLAHKPLIRTVCKQNSVSAFLEHRFLSTQGSTDA